MFVRLSELKGEVKAGEEVKLTLKPTAASRFR